jgi:hypothetical protein
MKLMMIKNEIVKVETLDNKSEVRWTEKIETIYPETIDIPNYQYGNNQNTLDYNISIRNKPISWSNYKIWTWTFTTTWSLSITWLWFKPKLVEIFCNNSASWFCQWKWDWTSQFVSYFDTNNAWFSTNYIIWYRNAWSTVAQWTLTTLDNDWFTLNISYLLTTTTYSYICYW